MLTHQLLVNGLEAPLLKLFNCGCGRCLDTRRQANTSLSLVSTNERGEAVHHVLFDVGLGVTDSLVAAPFFQGRKARLDYIALSHWHPDHTKELNRLCVSFRLSAKWRGEPLPPKIPLWCRSGTARFLEIEHSYEWKQMLTPHLSGEFCPPGTVLPLLELALPGVQITPVSVSHYTADVLPHDRQAVCYSCAAFVVETGAAKAVLLWDIDNQNHWLLKPETEGEKTAVSLMSDADYLFIDTSFWRSRPTPTTHPGFDLVRQIARRLIPQQTILMHMSGHPDGPGSPGWGWTNEQWREAAAAIWVQEALPGVVTVPEIGWLFNLSSPNP